MKKIRFTDEQMVKMLREADRTSVSEVAKKHGVSDQTLDSPSRATIASKRVSAGWWSSITPRSSSIWPPTETNAWVTWPACRRIQ
jgi:putative transposase